MMQGRLQLIFNLAANLSGLDDVVSASALCWLGQSKQLIVTGGQGRVERVVGPGGYSNVSCYSSDSCLGTCKV